MRPKQPLPIDASWNDADEYVDSLLNFISTTTLFQNLCGGVHILDFLTRKPGLYDTILPQEWRAWFELMTIEDVLDLLLREDLRSLKPIDPEHSRTWRGHQAPPPSLVEYIESIRRHSLRRELIATATLKPLPRHIAVGMRPKKIHEVTNFAAFVDDLSQTFKNSRANQSNSLYTEDRNQSKKEAPTVIDFGSGQNYLGRTLVCPPYNKHVIAIEQRHHNVEGAKGMDIHAKLAKKKKNMINKKDWKRQWIEKKEKRDVAPSSSRDASVERKDVPQIDWNGIERNVPVVTPRQKDAVKFLQGVQSDLQTEQFMACSISSDTDPLSDDTSVPATPSIMEDHQSLEFVSEVPIQSSKIQYVEKGLSDGNLANIVASDSGPAVVVSIHSCGNLTHHGLRSITLNPSVEAVAVIGCCYNLMTERLGPPTYKLPTLRSNHPRLEETSNAFDVHGFPMSRRLEQHEYEVCTNGETLSAEGIRLNITARMMAVQAPHNWGPKDSEEFFTRHYYRALLQRMLLDLGVVKMCSPQATSEVEYAGGSLSGKNDTGAPLIIGTLRKSCFKSFSEYVKGAVEKLSQDPVDGDSIYQKTRPLFEDDGQLIRDYETSYGYAKKELSIIWSLMAFSANVVESTIIVDRWLWLKEQDEVEEAWVEAVFDYKQSPRNMVVVGLKKQVT